MLEEQNFFRKYGTRFPQQLLSPRITSSDFLEFPKNSCFHYTVVDNVTTGPESDLFYLRHLSKKIPVKHITKLANNEGNPRQLTLLLDPVIRKFHARHRRFRLLRDNEPYPTDITNTLIVNHALCSHNYKYIRSPFSDYYRWINISSTIFYQMGKTAKDSSRHQYAIFNLPRQLPSITRLNTFATRQSQEMLKTFSDPGSALILEIWKWLDLETRSKSTLNFLDPSQLSKINIIFEESGKWILINLGLLDSWIQNKKSINVEQSLAVEHYKINNNKDLQSILNISMESIVDQKFSISSEQLRKIFLRCLMTLMEERTVETSSEEDGEIVDVNKVETEQSDEESNSHAEKLLKTLDDDLSQLEVIEKEQEIAESVQEANSQNSYKVSLGDKTIKVQDFDIKKDHHQIVTELCDKLATDGLMSGAEYRKMLSLNDKAANLQSPVEGVKMSDYIKVSQEDLTIKEAVFPDSVTILDKEQLKSSLNYYDKNYITKTLDKETIGMAFSTQKAGFLITDYKVEENNNILGSQVIHSFKVNPVIGKSSTIYFKVPKINPNGEFIVGGNKYRMRKQRSDLPIRKINHDTVQLSSYYGKVFVSRSNKKTDDYGDWLARSILEKSYEEGSVIKDVKPGSVFNNLVKTPVAFSSISREIRQFSCQGYNVLFDLKELQNTYTKDIFIKWYKKGFIIFGDDGKGNYVLIDINNTIYRTDLQKDPEVLSTIEEFLGLDAFKAPVAFIECRVFGSEIPIGLILAYYYGLTNLMQMLKVQPRRVIAGTRVNLQPHEFQIDFSDETLVFNKEDRLATLILAGFNSFHKTLKNYSVYKFDQKGVYLSVLETKKITTRYIRELDLLSDMFVDPITEGLLVMMKEPITFRGLLVRASELLLDDYYPDPLDIKYQAIRGYERVAGAVYSEMVLAIREQRKSLGRANSQISLNPLAVWKRITTDPAVKITEDINPIMDLKQQEAVTFNGVGGRSSRTINIASRAYHENDKGVISEATSESSDAGINTYLCSNPSFDSVRGTTFRRTDKELSAPNLLSTSSNLGVAIDTDDPKRILFKTVQDQHTVACDGYFALPVRTNYEQVISHRSGDLFSVIAEQDGVIESLNEVGGIIKYKDGSTKGFSLGRKFGKAAGQVIPHELVSNYSVGEKVKKGDVIAYNSGWFEKDYFNPGQVLMKTGLLATVALIESPQTHEDACTITEELAAKLKTNLSKVKKVRLNFKDTITDLIAIGAQVTFETPLVLIQDETTANMGAFNESTIATLASISQQAPTAKAVGKIEDIVVYYNGSKEDMSPSIRALANYGDKLLAFKAKSRGEQVFTGSTDESYRIDGDPLLQDELCVEFYITQDVNAGIADKVVFANQMKSIICEVADYDIVTESGIKVDAFFGAYSIFKRIVNSAFSFGTANILSEIGAREALKIYKGR